MGAIQRLNKQLFSTAAEMHAAQDGLTLGVLFGLSVLAPEVVTALFGILGVGGASRSVRARLVRYADRFVREGDIESNPEYFILPFLASAGVFVGVGVLLGIVSVPV